MDNVFVDQNVNVKLPDVLLNFVKESTKYFDDLHNHVHAIRVTNNAHIIMKSIKGENYNHLLLTYMSMVHDLSYYRHSFSIKRDELIEFLRLNVGESNQIVIMKIIENLSFSFVDEKIMEKIEEPFDVYMLCLSDAYFLEIISSTGIKQYENYIKIYGNFPKDMIKHCNQKLLKLLPENYIKTELGKKMAMPLHIEVTNYLKKLTI